MTNQNEYSFVTLNFNMEFEELKRPAGMVSYSRELLDQGESYYQRLLLVNPPYPDPHFLQRISQLLGEEDGAKVDWSKEGF